MTVGGSAYVGGNLNVLGGPVDVNGALTITNSNAGPNNKWNIYIDPSSYSNPELVFADSNGAPFVRFDNSNMYIDGNIIFGSPTNIPMWLLTDNVLNKCPCSSNIENEFLGSTLIDGDLTVNGSLCATQIANTLVTQSLELRSGTTMWNFAISNQYTSNPSLVVGSMGPGSTAGTYVEFFRGGAMVTPSNLNVTGASIVNGSLSVAGAIQVNGNLALLPASGPATGSNRSTWSNFVDEYNNLIFASSFGTRVEFNEMFSPELLNFTGKHRCVLAPKPKKNQTKKTKIKNLMGKIVHATGTYVDLDGNTTISIDEALPVVDLCKRPRDKRAFGVVGGRDDEGRFRIGNMSFLKRGQEPRVIVQSQGEGAIWVCDANGPLKNGDYITTSRVPGYGMRQGSGHTMNYTVAKITQDCNFGCAKFDGKNRRNIKIGGKTHRCQLVGCVYKF
jgi:hypothetical protein